MYIYLFFIDFFADQILRIINTIMIITGLQNRVTSESDVCVDRSGRLIPEAFQLPFSGHPRDLGWTFEVRQSDWSYGAAGRAG